MVNTLNVARCTVRALLLVAALASASAQDDDVPVPAGVSGLGTLNAAQRETVDRYVLENERPTGELKRLADRGYIAVRSSVALRHLFPHSRFVVVPWIFQLDPGAQNLYSIPFGLYDVLAISDEGRLESIFHSSGNQEEFGMFLRNHRVKVRNKTMLCEVARTRVDIYGGGGLSLCNDVRRSSSEWILGYTEMPFRPVSSYEEERDAYYYRLRVDSSGIVLDGKYVCDTLERRKIDNAGRSVGGH